MYKANYITSVTGISKGQYWLLLWAKNEKSGHKQGEHVSKMTWAFFFMFGSIINYGMWYITYNTWWFINCLVRE